MEVNINNTKTRIEIKFDDGARAKAWEAEDDSYHMEIVTANGLEYTAGIEGNRWEIEKNWSEIPEGIPYIHILEEYGFPVYTKEKLDDDKSHYDYMYWE